MLTQQGLIWLVKFTQIQVSTSLATKPTQHQREGLRAWSCVAEFARSTYHTIKLGNKARNVNKPGASHTPLLRLDFLAPRFVSRQKVEKE